MTYEGWIRLGGNEIVNNERARGYASTAACPMHWIKGPRCTTLADALGDVAYTAEQMPDAPWFDASMMGVSERFFGAYALSVAGLSDSTRSAPVVEGIDDGAEIGRTRRSARQVRVRVVLLAQGRDALDYGVAWLSASLDADACGQHGGGCGATDLEYFTDCPPARLPDEPDADYDARVDPYRRFLHNVTVTSGPLERELMNVGDFWGQVFEFTATAGRPWVYSSTRPVNLPVTPTVVIQDTPYNLVPYPSAELAGGVGISPNPCLQSNASGWAASITPDASAPADPAPFWSSGRSTTVSPPGCSGSFFGRLQGVGTGANVDGVSVATLRHEVDVTGVAVGETVDLQAFGRFVTVTGEGADAYSIQGRARWMTAADVQVGAEVPLGYFNTWPAIGQWQAFEGASTRPATATKVRIELQYVFAWNSGPTGQPALVDMHMGDADVLLGRVSVARNYSTNPSVEVNATGWSPGVLGAVPIGALTTGRVTGELVAVGAASYRVVFTATSAGEDGAFYAQQEVDISDRPAGARVSVNFWAAELLMAGEPERSDIRMQAFWRSSAGGPVLRTDELGTVPVNGGAVSQRGLLPPPGASHVLVRASAELESWTADTVLRLYADALAITVP